MIIHAPFSSEVPIECNYSLTIIRICVYNKRRAFIIDLMPCTSADIRLLRAYRRIIYITLHVMYIIDIGA